MREIFRNLATMGWDSELPWDEENDQNEFTIPSNILDSESLLHRLHLLNLPTPDSLPDSLLPVLSALLDTKHRDDRVISRLTADLRAKDVQMRDLTRQHKTELLSLTAAGAQTEKIRSDNSALKLKLAELKTASSKYQAKLGAAENLVGHYQKMLRVKKHKVPEDDVCDLLVSEEPGVEVIVDTFFRDAIAPNVVVADEVVDKEGMSEIDIFRGLVDGG